jgi:ELWxxDGT repeat protein
MSLSSWLGFRSSRASAAAAPRYRHRQLPRPHVEALEDRCLPASGLSAALVADIAPGALSSSPRGLTNADGTLFFGVWNQSVGTTSSYQVWKSDGTADGTVLIKDGLRGASNAPIAFAGMGGSVFFGDPGDPGLWKTDGTAAGTVLLQSVYAGQLTPVDTGLFFSGYDSDNGSELWVSDGTAEGTRLVKDLYSGSSTFHDGGRTCTRRCRSKEPNGSGPGWLTELNGTVYFAATDNKHGRELWRSDGTDKGTTLVKDIVPRKESSSPQYLTIFDGRLHFGAHDGLWTSDGTESGTVRVKALAAAPSQLTEVNGTLFFTVDDGVNGQELWKSDGTPAGTVLVKDVSPGSAGSNPRDLTNASDTLFFTADDDAHGRELWKSDGTAAGTVLVADVLPGGGPALPGDLTNVNGLLYFSADDGANGRELWQSDGTAAGTVMVQDIYPGSTGSHPAWFAAMNNKLFFAASDPEHGRELWDPPPVGPTDGGSLGAHDNASPDLGGATPGLAAGHTIWIDATPGGWGWFVDATPWKDSKFTTPGDQGEVGHMDLLTVLTHEMGHLLDHDHGDEGLMQETLSPGTRLGWGEHPDVDVPGWATDALFALLAAEEDNP